MKTIQNWWLQMKAWIRRIQVQDLIMVAVGLCLALLVRLSLHDYYTRDYYMFTSCYQTFHKEGFAALGRGCSNYSPFYEDLLYVESVLFPRLSNTAGTKLPGIGFDFVCAGLVYLVVRHWHKVGPLPLIATFAFLFAPTVIINSAGWGQIDIIYTTFLLACVYFVMKERSWLACLSFGMAIAVKLQGIVLIPFLLLAFLRGRIPWKALLIIPVPYLVSMIPPWIAGRPLVDLLTVYVGQVNLYTSLSMHAPNIYTWIPNEFSDQFYLPGLLFGGSVCLAYVAVALKSRARFTPPLIVLLASVSVLITPYFLPKMHERYFFPADVLLIILAAYFPKYFYVPVTMILVSFFAYQPYLFQQSTFPLPVLALAVLGLIVVLVRQMLVELYLRNDTEEGGAI